MLRGRQQVDGDEPPAEGELGAVHDGSSAEGLEVSAAATLEHLLAVHPVVVGVSADGADEALTLAHTAELVAAGLLVGEAGNEVVEFHGAGTGLSFIVIQRYEKSWKVPKNEGAFFGLNLKVFLQ